MKNIHLLPTDKPSRLSINCQTNLLQLGLENRMFHDDRNIYITSDEEIKEGDWLIDDCESDVISILYKCLEIKQFEYIRSEFNKHDFKDCKKIILTTDKDLIKDGVQAINDEFLEWFVKNPNCEEVDINYENYKKGVGLMTSTWRHSEDDKYKIIIPKEEPCDNCNNEVCCCIIRKQETLEEITEQIQKDCHKFVESIISKVTYQDATNTFLFMKLAELTLKLKKYE